MARMIQVSAKQESKQESRGNQKNNWALEKRGITLAEFSKLKGTLFKQTGSSGAWRLAKPKLFKFAAVAYFYFNNNDEKSSPPNKCERVLRIFVQLNNRLYFDDVETNLGMKGLVEWEYDKLNPDRSAVDAAKACYAVIGNCQSWMTAGELTLKGAKSRAGIKSPSKVTKGKGTRVKSQSEDSSPAASSADDDGDDSIEEASEDMSDEDSEKFVTFGLESDSEESLTKKRAKKRKGNNQEARPRKKKRESKGLTMVLQMLKEQKVETSKISKGFAELTSEVDTMRAARDLKTSEVTTVKTRKQINEDSESDDNKEKETNIAVVNNKSVNETNKTDKGAPKEDDNHQDLLPFFKDNAKGESTPIKSAETEHDKKGGKEAKTANTVIDESITQFLLQYCANEEEVRISKLTEKEIREESTQLLQSGEVKRGLDVLKIWYELHGRFLLDNQNLIKKCAAEDDKKGA